MQLMMPFIARRAVMESVCTNKTGEQRYTAELLDTLPKWLEEPRNEIMTRGATLVGFSRSRAVWCFGYMAGSDHAKAYGVDVGDEGLCFILAKHNGDILAVFNEYAIEMPKELREVIDSKLW